MLACRAQIEPAEHKFQRSIVVTLLYSIKKKSFLILGGPGRILLVKEMFQYQCQWDDVPCCSLTKVNRFQYATLLSALVLIYF